MAGRFSPALRAGRSLSVRSENPAPVPKIFITLPAYNEAESLPPLFESFQRAFAGAPPGSWRLITVDDGSRDATLEVLRRHADALPLDLVVHERNRGLGEAIKSGLRRALELSDCDDDIIVGMDADDTHPPETIPAMVRLIREEGADLVIASRYQRGSRQVGVPLRRKVLSWGALVIFHLFLNLPGVRDYTCGFRACRAGLARRGFEVFGDAIITRSGFACTDELLVHLATLNPVIREVPFTLRYDRKRGRSKLQLGITVLETLRLVWRHRGILREARAREAASRRPGGGA